MTLDSWRCVVILATLLGLLALTTAAESPMLSQEVEGLLHVVSLTGFEAPAVRYIRQRLDGLPVVEDTLGNLTSGSVPVVRGASWPVLWMRLAMWHVPSGKTDTYGCAGWGTAHSVPSGIKPTRDSQWSSSRLRV